MKYALTNMFLLDGHENMSAQEGKAILVNGDKIEAVVNAAEIPAEYTKKDLGGAYILPGLINLHIHIPASGKPKKKKTDYEKLGKLFKIGVVKAVVKSMCEGLIKQQLLSGTTTVRAVGGVDIIDTQLRDKVNAGKIQGPRILAANYAISVPGGHMTGSVALPAGSAEEAAQMVVELSKSKPDLIKLMITGGVLDAEVPGEPGVLRMPPEYVKAACDKAHELGYMVAAHVESNEGMIVALENGVDTIEHGGKPSPEATELFKKTGAKLVSTLSPIVPFAVMDQTVTGFTDTDLINGKALYQFIIDNTKELLANGVTVGLGTDTGCPFITHYDMWREVWYFANLCGVGNAFALHTATEVNASIAGISDITGTIDAGKSADFMVVKENPLDDIAALRNPAMVVFRGNVIENPKPDKFPEVEEALDAVMKMLA